MTGWSNKEAEAERMTHERANVLYREQVLANYRRVDQLFAVLLTVEWFSAIVFSLLVSPYAWAGATGTLSVHMWTAIVLGTAIVSLPVTLVWLHPGDSDSTRRGHRPDAHERSIYPPLRGPDRDPLPHLWLASLPGVIP